MLADPIVAVDINYCTLLTFHRLTSVNMTHKTACLPYDKIAVY